MRIHERVEMLGEPDVVSDHLQVAPQPHLPQRQPHFQRPEAARVLGAVLEVVGDLVSEVVVARMIGERPPQVLGVTNELISRASERFTKVSAASVTP